MKNVLRRACIASVVVSSSACTVLGPSLSALTSDNGAPSDPDAGEASTGDPGGGADGARRCDGSCEPEVVVTNEAALGSIVVRDGRLAWTSGKVLRSCRASACAATAQRVGMDWATANVASRLTIHDGDRIHFGTAPDPDNAGVGVAFYTAFDGSRDEAFGYAASQFDAVLTEGETSYVALQDGNIMRCVRPCNPFVGQWEHVAADAAPTLAMALGPTKLYWIRGGTNGGLFSCPRDGCTGEPVVEIAAADPQGLVIDARGVTVTIHGDGRVLRCPFAGCDGNPSVLQEAPASAPYGIASTGTSLVWANEGDGTVVACAVDDCAAPEVIARIDRPRFVAASDGEIFVTSTATSSIYRVVR